MQLNLLSPTILNTPFSNFFVSTEIIRRLYISKIAITMKRNTIIPKIRPSNKLPTYVSFIVSSKVMLERRLKNPRFSDT